jgi:hypothetical protein
MASKSRKQPVAVKAPETISLGSPGLDHSYGYVREELHPQLQGRKAMLIYREMAENNAALSGALYVISSYMRKVKWHVTPASESAGAKSQAVFVWQCLNDMDRPWSDIVNENATSMMTFGFSVAEPVFKYRRGPTSESKRFRSRHSDGKVGWRCIDLRAQETICKWDIAEDGEILGAYQEDGIQQVYLPKHRFALFRTSTYKNNPEGRSILRGAYRSWHFAKRLEETEAVGAVRSLVNLPKVTIPLRYMSPNATVAEKAVRAQYERMVSLLSKDRLSGLVLPAEMNEEGKPTGYKFELVGSQGVQMPVDPIIRRYDARMLMSLAAEFLLLGTEKQGSFALGAEKSSSFVKSLEFYADIIADEFNLSLIPKLMMLNNVPAEEWPTLTHDPIDEVSVTALGQFLSQAAGFLTPTIDLENNLRGRINVGPVSEEDFEEAREAAEPPDPAPNPNGGAEPASDE